jgi:LysM repeat protein
MAVYHTVVWGDTLSEIAVKYKTTEDKLVKLNNIKNRNLIYVGQKLLISGSVSSTSSSSTPSSPTKTTNSNRPKITAFGLQTKTDRTIFVTWDWSKSNTENYQVLWKYATGDGVGFIGQDSTEEYKQSLYNAPSNATKVSVKIKPISKKKTVNNKETSYWTAEWSEIKTYNFSDNPPTKPDTPDIQVEGLKLTATLDNLNVGGTYIHFQVTKDNSKTFAAGNAKIERAHASFSCNLEAGHEYKVRCRSYKGDEYGPWSDYSDNKKTPPKAPTGITELRAISSTSVFVDWDSVPTATSYVVEYATQKRYFDSSTEVSSITVDEGWNHVEITGLATGDEYFFRVRAINNEGESGWTEIKSIAIGKDPIAPTTWSSTTTAVVGEPLNLYWIHNAEDGSYQTYARIELTVDGEVLPLIDISYPTVNEDEEVERTSVYAIDTKNYPEGTKIQWRVCTAGITKKYGDWSIQRTVDIYAPATLELDVTDVNGNDLDVLTSFPFYVRGLAGPNTQVPIGYHLSVVANEVYETVDSVGNVKMVNVGDAVYSRYFDINETLVVEMSANNINLENGVSYTVNCTVSMNSGLNTTSSKEFTVSWTDVGYTPNAEISINKDNLTASVKPYCEYYPVLYYKVVNNNGVYTRTSEVLDELEGMSIEDAYIDDIYMVYAGVTSSGENVYFCIMEAETPILVEGVSLSVYRREFDGTFTELATGIDNTRNTFITDPHPALDYARYRIVAIDISTGAVSYSDLPGEPVGEPAVVIQWDEEWSQFDVSEEDELEKPPWAGSMLKLPYNVDVSDNFKGDVSLINYIGRSHPVTYYGTQVGHTANWSMDVPKNDTETLYGLRRLATWMGDVYVREPSGSGYNANITVSFSQKHTELVIPVSLSVTRVEGGA